MGGDVRERYDYSSTTMCMYFIYYEFFVLSILELSLILPLYFFLLVLFSFRNLGSWVWELSAHPQAGCGGEAGG